MKKILFFALLSVILTFSMVACHKQEEGELITTVQITLTPAIGGTTDTFVWKDLDGPGGNAPIQSDTIRLKDSMEYLAQISFLNEGTGNSTDITTEIRNEAKNHLVCLSGLPLTNLIINPTDSDGQYPIGLESKWETQLAGTGLLRVNLRHQPQSKNGKCDIGESDVDVMFNVVIMH